MLSSHGSVHLFQYFAVACSRLNLLALLFDTEMGLATASLHHEEECRFEQVLVLEGLDHTWFLQVLVLWS